MNGWFILDTLPRDIVRNGREITNEKRSMDRIPRAMVPHRFVLHTNTGSLHMLKDTDGHSMVL